MSHTFEISLQICEGARKLHPFKLAVEMRPEETSRASNSRLAFGGIADIGQASRNVSL
jgi:hypothetical protein